METRFRLKEQDIYRLIYTMVLVCIALFSAGKFMGIAKLTGVHFLAAFCVVTLAVALRILSEKGRVVCAVSVVAFLVVMGMTVGARNCIDFFYSYFQWLIGGSLWMDEWKIGYELIQIFIVATLCYALQIIFEKYFFLKCGIVCLLICALLFELLTEKPISHSGVVFCMCYMVMVYVEWIQFDWKKIRSREKKAHMLWVMPFILGYFLCLLLMPAPEKAYEWKFVKAFCSQIKESFLSLTQNLKWNEKNNYDMALSGFSEDGELRGNIRENNREIMIIQGQGNLADNVYLSGRIYDTFDGREWKQENRDAEPVGYMDTIETWYAIRRFDKKYTWDYLRKINLKIRYQYFNTSYFFVPLKLDNIKDNEGVIPFSWDGGSLFSDSKKGYGTEYEVGYYQLNVGTEEFDKLLTAVLMPDESTLERILDNYKQKKVADISTKDLDEYSRRVYDIYLDEVNLSEEAQNYLSEITEYAENDVEKLRLIEQELASFTYTQTPGELPDTVSNASEFLDYFLLESRQGYCTYFATAFTLLARAEGIPARYVQGFLVPLDGEKEMSVYGNMAHSWPEVYINGIGWIPFEPTPGYTQIRYNPWKTSHNAEDISAVDSDYPIDSTEIPEKISVETEEPYLPENVLEEVETTEHFLNIWKIVFYTILAVFVVCIIMFVSDYILKKRRYQRMNSTEKFQAEVNGNMKILAWLGLRRNGGETLQEFRMRVKCSLEFGEKPVQFIENYEAVLYGGKAVDEGVLMNAIRERKLLFEIMKNKKKWRYFYYWIRVEVL